MAVSTLKSRAGLSQRFVDRSQAATRLANSSAVKRRSRDGLFAGLRINATALPVGKVIRNSLLATSRTFESKSNSVLTVAPEILGALSASENRGSGSVSR
jgi:hypothetical protein